MSLRISFFRRIPSVLFLVAALNQVILAQSAPQSASLSGRVTDPSSAAVPHAQVTLTNNQDHTVEHATTSQVGLYTLSPLRPGTYTLTVEANNFARYEDATVHITFAQSLTHDVGLQINSVSQSVTVRDEHESLQEISTVGKTGTKLEDLPGSVQVIPKEILKQQGAVMLRQSLSNASGVNYGGQDSKGFYDHFLIRGLNATIYSDNFTDGDQLGGVTHSLNGVERLEVLEGPGSALFGSGAPGGTISLVHYTPSSERRYGINLQGGSFGTVSNYDYATGPTGVAGLNYRVDATFTHSDGFRRLNNHDYEVRPSLEWQLPNHIVDFAVDARHIHDIPDSYGLIYFNGAPIQHVSINAKYSTPFAFANQPFVRPTLTDTWQVNKSLTISSRFSYLYRTLDSLGNGDSTSTKVTAGQVVGRQLRKQNDNDGTFDLQFEPVWRFSTGTIHHTLLTGFGYLHQEMDTSRTSADLPNIPDAFNPVPPEISTAGVTFLCDAKHSCDDDKLSANYFGLYATDQIDVTDRLKIRAGFRQDWFHTSLTPQISVPGRFGTDGQPLLAGVKDTRNDNPVSWNAGILYKVRPQIIPYFGASTSNLANFNSENTQNGVGAPESATQYEAGIKFPLFNNRIALNTAVFHVDRDHVATLVTLNGVETIVFDSQRTRGFEASFDGKVTEQWHLLANVTYQNPLITDNPQGITSVGNRPQGAPAHIANLWTTYDFSMAGLRGFKAGAGLNYLGKTFSDITNVNSIPSYVIGNANFGYDRPSWGLHIITNNFTNRRYFLAGNAAGAYVGNSAAVYGQVTWNLGSHQ
jgi:iron complex outermembrane recepter protein